LDRVLLGSVSESVQIVRIPRPLEVVPLLTVLVFGMPLLPVVAQSYTTLRIEFGVDTTVAWYSK
jgi:hypothetical protein